MTRNRAKALMMSVVTLGTVHCAWAMRAITRVGYNLSLADVLDTKFVLVKTHLCLDQLAQPISA